MARVDQVAGIDHRSATKLRKSGIRMARGLSEAVAATRAFVAPEPAATPLQPSG